jgi:bifunctional non-homologous end joining protein LigD
MTMPRSPPCAVGARALRLAPPWLRSLNRCSPSQPLPEEADWRFELKVDGFRAIVSTTSGLRIRSRRGWRMEHLLPELADLPPRLTLDGELIAWGEDKFPSFPRLCERMLQSKRGIPIAYLIFDVLEWDGLGLLNWTFRQRREVLEKLNLRGSHWDTAMSFEDGQRLFNAVCAVGLEGIVAKRLLQRYRPGERLWVKKKNPSYWRYPLEREAAIRSRWRVTI